MIEGATGRWPEEWVYRVVTLSVVVELRRWCEREPPTMDLTAPQPKASALIPKPRSLSGSQSEDDAGLGRLSGTNAAGCNDYSDGARSLLNGSRSRDA
jgi:hypothetical protein